MVLYRPKSDQADHMALVWFKKELANFDTTTMSLKQAVNKLTNDNKPDSILAAKQSFKQCRLQYKKIAFLGFFFRLIAPNFLFQFKHRRGG